MNYPGRTIWDTRVQSICGILTAAGSREVEIYFSASFAPLSLDPPRVIVNPNRTHSIDEAIQSGGRFAINVLGVDQLSLAARIVKMPRRLSGKAMKLGLDIRENELQIPFISNCLQTLFCEVEREIPSGDRKLLVARILDSSSRDGSRRPLLFGEVTSADSDFPLKNQVRTVAVKTGMLDAVKSVAFRVRKPPPADIAKTTYEMAGATEAEIEQLKSYGLKDTSRHLTPPAMPAIVRNRLGICVVGTGWGSFHCETIRKANPNATLFVCGRDPDRTQRLARAVGAADFFVDLEQAASDSRVQALTLALPHDFHRTAVEVVANAGKHALVEKPIATTLADADAMIATAQKAGTILMVAEDMHFRPVIREAVRSLSLGDIGEPLHMLVHGGGIRQPRGWAATKDRMGGGVMIDIGVHYVRAMRLLMGEPDRVFASRAMQIHTKIEGEDSVQVMFSSDLGWQTHMLLSWSTQRGQLPDIVVAGHLGTFHCWPGARFYDYFPVSPRLLTRALSFVRPHSLRDKLMRPSLQQVRRSVKDADPTGYRGEFEEFMAAVSEDRPPVTLPQDARRDLEIVLAAYASLESGVPTLIPPLK
jgi:myo-inositol 2-dehydrogenase / D-chiro-inositol 1-dehydrogenase